MQWLILKDPSFNPEYDEKPKIGYGHYTSEDRVRVRDMQPSERDAFLAEYTKDWPFEFRLLDGDREVYYEGRCGELDRANETKAFAPLDWAMNDAGCAEMQYRKVGMKQWKTL